MREIAGESGGGCVLVGRRTEALQDLKDKYPSTVATIVADVSDMDSIKKIFDEIQYQKFRLSGLVYAAGIEGVMPLKVMTMDFMDGVMRTNCLGFVEMCKYMSNKKYSLDGASIVAVSSLAGMDGNTYIGELAYCVSKAALNKAVKGASRELLRRKIRVNAVLPATTDTEMISNSYMVQNSDLSEVLKEQPFGIIPPKYVAEVINFLLSDESRFITGACIPISAGRNI